MADEFSPNDTAQAWWFKAATGVFIVLVASFALWFATFTVDSYSRMYSKLVEIDRTTAVFNTQLDNLNHRLEDHEERIKDLEKYQRNK